VITALKLGNTRRIKQDKKKAKQYKLSAQSRRSLHLPRLQFYKDYVKIFVLADGKTERVSRSKINFKIS